MRIELDDVDAGDQRVEHVGAAVIIVKARLDAGLRAAVLEAVAVRGRDDARLDAFRRDDGRRLAPGSVSAQCLRCALPRRRPRLLRRTNSRRFNCFIATLISILLCARVFSGHVSFICTTTAWGHEDAGGKKTLGLASLRAFVSTSEIHNSKSFCATICGSTLVNRSALHHELQPRRAVSPGHAQRRRAARFHRPAAGRHAREPDRDRRRSQRASASSDRGVSASTRTAQTGRWTSPARGRLPRRGAPSRSTSRSTTCGCRARPATWSPARCARRRRAASRCGSPTTPTTTSAPSRRRRAPSPSWSSRCRSRPAGIPGIPDLMHHKYVVRDGARSGPARRTGRSTRGRARRT